MTKFTDHIHSEILNIAEKNLNSDQGVSHDNFDNILTDISVCMEKLGIKENIIDEVTSSFIYFEKSCLQVSTSMRRQE